MAILSSVGGRVAAAGAVVTVVALVAVAATVGHGESQHSVADPGRWVAATAHQAGASPSPKDPTSSSPSQTPSPSSKPAPAKKAAKQAPSRKPVPAPAPPPQHPAPPPVTASPDAGASCPKLTGPLAPHSQVQQDLVTASGTAHWPTIGGPAITLPPALTEAMAWEESGWQSTILSCDGGIGTMQIMTDTASWANQKFHTNYDVHTLAGNVGIGAEYLQWLTKYFGDVYFNGTYTLAPDPDKLALLDCVISAYQAGFGTVDDALSKPDGTLPNWWYVNAVEQFMISKPWTST